MNINKLKRAANIWLNLGYASAVGYANKHNIDMGLVRIVRQLEAVKAF